jgi:inositol transport system ATP-binding protein
MTARTERIPLLHVEGVEKSFPGVKALDGVQLRVGTREVHALLGENGAGKSTLLKILSGAQAPDAGTMKLGGNLLNPRDTPISRQQAGVVTIYQEFNLLPEMSVAENMYLGREPLRRKLIDWTAMYTAANVVLAELGLALDSRTLVRALSVAEQQMVEIAKAMTFNARLIIMDEPTAALSNVEVATLHRIIRELRDRGTSIIYVTHRLAEVIALCDRFTVLRDGRFIADGEVAGQAEDDLIRLMVGRPVEYTRRRRRSLHGEVVLRVEGVSRARAGRVGGCGLADLSFDVRAAEILGFAGLIGAGRTDLARIIFGAESCDAGVLWVGRERMAMLRSPSEAIRQGIALVPEDRKRDGCFLDLSIRLNLSLPSLKRLSRWKLFVNDRAEAALVDKYRREMNIKTNDDQTPIGKLSGGNQQKVLLARSLALSPRVLIVDEPTRGIDVGAKAEVHHLLEDMASRGVSIIVISSELPEILALSDRIAVFREGRLIGIVDADATDDETLMRLMATGSRGSPPHQPIYS